MRVLIVIISVCCVNLLFGQQTYFKQIELFNDFSKLPQKVITHNNEMYLATKVSCHPTIDTFSCLAVSKHDFLGELQWVNTYKWTSTANANNIIQRNDSIFVAGHIIPDSSRQVLNLLVLNTDGDSLFSKVINLQADTIDVVFCNGIHLSNKDLYFYNQSGNIINGDDYCRIVKYNLDTEQVEVWDYIAEEGIYFPSWDMEEDQDGNLLIYNERYDVNDIDEVLEILKIDKQGNILNQIVLSGPRFIRVGYNFILLDDGNYCFVNATKFSSNRPAIQTSDPEGNKIWAYEFPNPILVNFAGYYDINELHKTNNGDIIAVGNRRRIYELGTGTDIFLARFSADGDLLWAKNYNTIEDEETMAYHRYFPTDVDEFDDGSLIIVGTASHHDDIVLLRVGADGFLEGVEGNDDIAVHTEDVSDDLIAVLFPNPMDGYMSLDFDKSISGDYKCIDITGALMDQGYLHNQDQLQLDYTHLQAGRYYIILYDGYKYRNFAFVKE